MQEVQELTVKELNFESVDEIKELYENFASRSLKDYRLDNPALHFDGFKELVRNGLFLGFILHENNIPKGFLLYLPEHFTSIELNIIHLIDDKNTDNRRTKLIEQLLGVLKDQESWKVISYPHAWCSGIFC